MRNGDERTVSGIELSAVPAYNLVQSPEPRSKFHPEGQYNSHLATFGDFTVYVAGDTECVPEMNNLGEVDLAFIPINLPYTVPPEEAVGCIKVISPEVVVRKRCTCGGFKRPGVAVRRERQEEDAECVLTNHLAVGLSAGCLIKARPTRSHDELADALRVWRTIGQLGREPFIQMVVTAKDDVYPGATEDVPKSFERAVTAVSAGTELRMMPVGEDALSRVRPQILL